MNLTCGKGPSADIAFHLNPRLLQRCLVRNSRLNGQWGEEETTSPVKFAFEPKKKFNLSIFVGKGEFLVCLDRAFLCSYRFRVSLSKVTAIEVVGDVEVYGVEYKKLGVYPEGTAENSAITVAMGRRQNGDHSTQTTMVISHFSQIVNRLFLLLGL